MAQHLGRSTLVGGLFALALLSLLILLWSPHEPETSVSPGTADEPAGFAGGEAAEPGAEGWATFEAEAMATTVRVTVAAAPSGIAPEEAAEAVFEVFRRVDAEMSEWQESSPLSEVNRRAGGEPVAVPAELLGVIRRGIEIGELTGGAFDVTWAALWGLWDFRAAEPRVPPADEVARRAQVVNYRRLELDEAAGTVRLPEPGMMIGLGGIAKGHALERAAAVLRERGLESFLLVSGGQVYAAGDRAGRGAWRVGIRDPRGGPEDLFARLELRDASASTSGDYESFFLADGVRYHHILDPRTGRPARGLRSATVVSGDPVLADALSTGIFVMGPEAGLALAERLPGAEAVLIDDDGRVLVTSGLESELEPIHVPRR